MTRISHAGELVGYDKWGRPIRVPAGGAADGAIVVDDKDDDDTSEPDDDKDDDDSAPPAAPPRRQSYRELMEANARLQAAVKRNNRENAALRHVADLAKTHNLTPEELTELVTQRNTAPPPAEVPPADQTAPPPPETPPADTPPASDEKEFNRRLELELARRGTAADDRASALAAALRSQVFETQLRGAGYTGSLEVAAKIVDMDSMEVGDDGKVGGVADAIESLRKEIPALFRRPGTAPPPRRGGDDVDGGNKQRTPPPAKQDWATRTVNTLLGKS